MIPRRNLSPNSFPETFVLQAPFPPDDRSVGYERGTSVSKAWDQATTDAAIEVAGYVVAHLKELAGVADGAADREPKTRANSAGDSPSGHSGGPSRTNRRRSSSIASSRMRATWKRPSSGWCSLVLKSPRFLYREIGGGKLDGYDVASRLSFGLWDSLPDQLLLEAAAAGQLTTREQVARQAERMVADLRARSKLREFFLQWLKVDQAPGHRQRPQAVPPIQ